MILGAPSPTRRIHQAPSDSPPVARKIAQIAGRRGDRVDHRAGAVMRDIGNGEAEVEARRIAHLRVAAGIIGMHRIIRLHIGEGRDDDAPDALDGVERQEPLVTLDQRAHHLRLAIGSKGAADALRALHGDQPVDDLAALHQQPMHVAIDPVDLVAQFGKRVRGGHEQRRILHGALS